MNRHNRPDRGMTRRFAIRQLAAIYPEVKAISAIHADALEEARQAEDMAAGFERIAFARVNAIGLTAEEMASCLPEGELQEAYLRKSMEDIQHAQNLAAERVRVARMALNMASRKKESIFLQAEMLTTLAGALK